MRLYTLSGIYRESVLAVEREKEKKEKERKEKREKQRGFPKDRFGVLAPFLSIFLGAKLSGELG